MSKIVDRIANLTEEEQKAITNLPLKEKQGFFELVLKCVENEEENSKNYAESEKSAKNISGLLFQSAQNLKKLSNSCKQLELSAVKLTGSVQNLFEKEEQILAKMTEAINLSSKMVSQSKKIAAQALEIYFKKADDSKLHQA